MYGKLFSRYLVRLFYVHNCRQQHILKSTLGLMLYMQLDTVLTTILPNVFPQLQSTPERDTDVFTAKATLRNSEKLILQTSWNWDFLHDVTEGTKDRIPAMTDAVLKFINKYHTAHFGFDLNRGGMKLKNSVSNLIERAYHEVPMSLPDPIKYMYPGMYRRASDTLMSMRMQTVIDRLAHESRLILSYTEEKINALLDAVRQFFMDREFTVPGFEEKLSIVEMFKRAHSSVSVATNRAPERFISLMKEKSNNIMEMEFTIPGIDMTINGNEIMDKLKSSTRFVSDQLGLSVLSLFNVLRMTVDYLVKVITEKGDGIITYLQDRNMEIAPQVDAIHAEVMQHIEEAKTSLAEYKDLTKRNIQVAYNALNMERVNDDTKELFSIFQSHFYGGLNGALDLMRITSESTEPYIKVSNRKMDIEIPLPFHWKSFNEWPKHSWH